MLKGIILAGGDGANLRPLTLGIPKQLLPLYNKPMIYYPISLFKESGIRDILIITTSEHQPLFKKYLGDGAQYGVTFYYAIQNEPNGIAEAMSIGKDFIGEEGICLITGDTILTGGNIPSLIAKAEKAVRTSGSATIFVKRDPDENQYGKVILNKQGKCMDIVGTSNTYYYTSMVGLYVLPNDAIGRVQELELSERGRYEIIDLTNTYFEDKKLQILTLPNECIWWDTNSPDSILSCSNYLRKIK